ncbi:DUF4352 domain-containing protein [Bacillus sp. FSL K6-3431]|uniref:DUF4352 domain-containing protein n=1 Tax=Bacillus sp. FSL K6-3431 TaxID=2921500 RepID=UPI0030F58DFE
MKRILIMLGTLLLSITIFAACSSNSNEKENDEPIKENNTGEGTGEANQSKDVDEQTKDENETSGDKENNEEKSNTSSGDFKDQTDLKIGDSGQAESTLGKHEITIHSVKMLDEIDGEAAMFDHFFVAEITLKNIGDKPIDAEDTIASLEITEDLEGSGSGDDSSFFNSIEALTGTIEPGQSIKGEAVFDGREANTYYIRTVSGLIASGAVKNKTTWIFEKSETQ